MIGKLIAAYVGDKIMARSGRGGAGALGGLAAATLARRGGKSLAMLLAAGYGLKKLNDYRRSHRAAAA